MTDSLYNWFRFWQLICIKFTLVQPYFIKSWNKPFFTKSPTLQFTIRNSSVIYWCKTLNTTWDDTKHNLGFQHCTIIEGGSCGCAFIRGRELWIFLLAAFVSTRSHNCLFLSPAIMITVSLYETHSHKIRVAQFHFQVMTRFTLFMILSLKLRILC